MKHQLNNLILIENYNLLVKNKSTVANIAIIVPKKVMLRCNCMLMVLSWGFDFDFLLVCFFVVLKRFFFTLLRPD